MRKPHLKYLRCPECASEFDLDVQECEAERVKTGALNCKGCKTSFKIVKFIPRLVSSEFNYADDFGFQWNKHFRTQYDSYSGVKVSEERFFNETGWPRSMKGQVILEAGSGSGRFTEHAAVTGATVLSFDYSHAVEANYRNNGHFENLLIVQGSIFNMPFEKGFFDKVLCIGVIQHTPDPEAGFMALTQMLKPGGHLVIDAYERLPGWKHYFETKYWVRPITRRIPNEKLYQMCDKWVNFIWPVLRASYQVTGRRTLSWFLLVADYRGVYPLSEDKLKEWSVLDSFDMLAPEYDYPQTIASVTEWYQKAGLEQIEVKHGYNDIQGSGFKPKG
jgi:SAM-dependent methyltransferase